MSPMLDSSHALGLLTDFYELTMAQAYWKSGVADHRAAFNLTLRANPFDGGYTVACGLSQALEVLARFSFDESDAAFLARQNGNDGQPLFDGEFLRHLRDLHLSCDIDAVPEGTVVFPDEPLLRVTGPVLQAQLLETSLLATLNFQSLIATKAARVCRAARGAPVLEFGMRRAQGLDGGLSASRAAYIGGCAATSNTLAGKLHDLPVSGTMAHSWVMFFDTEAEAFSAYARALPNNCAFLVDTYDSMDGVRHAIEMGHRLRQGGHEMIAVRLDSGDLVKLSIQARQMLDDAGFSQCQIIGTGDLDEHRIEDIRNRGGTISLWGVGTRLATAHDDPALQVVYKLAALRHPHAPWQRRIKLSEETGKASLPGPHQVRRFRQHHGPFLADAIYDLEEGIPPDCVIVERDSGARHPIPAGTPHTDLLVPVVREGKPVYECPPAKEARQRAREQLDALPAAVTRTSQPARYLAGLEEGLFHCHAGMAAEARQTTRRASLP
jgi:nicotinate phosphoribosyltransferase